MRLVVHRRHRSLFLSKAPLLFLSPALRSVGLTLLRRQPRRLLGPAVLFGLPRCLVRLAPFLGQQRHLLGLALLLGQPRRLLGLALLLGLPRCLVRLAPFLGQQRHVLGLALLLG